VQPRSIQWKRCVASRMAGQGSGYDTLSLVPAIRDAIWAINANIPLAYVYTLEELLARSVAPIHVNPLQGFFDRVATRRSRRLRAQFGHSGD
jgi:hypothetical protein